jgi:hypothetical protein
MTVLDDHYEEKLDMYKVMTYMYRSRVLNWLAQTILGITGNKKIGDTFKSLRSMSQKELN